jgi:hypothetical protein
MSWGVSAVDRSGNPVPFRVIPRREKSTEKLYWRLNRPRARVYARAVRDLVIYRVAAAVAATVAITLAAFIGGVVGDIAYPRWPPMRSIRGVTINLASVHEVAQIRHWGLAFVALGAIVAGIPRVHRWMFRVAVLGGASLGYYQHRLPPLPRSAAAVDISGWTARLTYTITKTASPSSIPVAVIPLVLVAVGAYVAYSYAYRFAARTTELIPRRPVSHYYSSFRGVMVTRRLAAVPVAAAVLSVAAWVVELLRGALPGVQYAPALAGFGRPSTFDWAAAVAIVALVICAPHPQGQQWLLILLLFAITAYAFSPHVYLLRIPAWAPTSPAGFWVLAVTYVLVTNVGFDLVSALLDWPT